MTHGGTVDNIINRQREYAARTKEGQCTHCRPHRGENERRPDQRWVDGVRIPSKPKESK